MFLKVVKSHYAMFLCPVIHALHQNAQHWKQYKLWVLVLSQFPHFTPLLSCSLMATTSSRFTRRKLVGSSLRSPLLGTLISVLHSGSGHVKVSGRPLDRRTCSKQFRQKLCKHGSILGSVLRAWHFEQETSLQRFWRLCVKSSVSMTVAARQLAIDQLSTGRQNITAAESALIFEISALILDFSEFGICQSRLLLIVSYTTVWKFC